ncbi:hypothetical protein ACM26W_19385 [Halomonas sp. HK25]|uniref:hypothetical protein n=1 Tax=Halomonas sp. HK25 TaxID=3394321 RepID=UPI0039FD3C88
MISTNFIKKLGILGVSMGLVASPLAFSEEVTLPAVTITAEQLASLSMRSDPINDPRDFTQAAFWGGHLTSIPVMLISPSFRSDPVNDPQDLTQPAFPFQGHLISIPVMLISPSFRSDPSIDLFPPEEPDQ